MKQKHIDAAREARLWVVQIIGPAVGILLMIVPKSRELIVERATDWMGKLGIK